MAILCAPVWADESETQALRKEVEELKQKVQKLEEQQATKLQSGQAASSAEPSSAPAAKQPAPQVSSPSPPQHPAPVPATAASTTNSVPALRESWSRVAKNMSQAEIADVLGQPSRETHIDGKLVWYYYYPGIGGASVFFKSNGHVSSYQSPHLGWW
jgi:Tfp pilus assembly protein FimV